MDAILNKISNLTFYGFYDPSKKMVTVHFFNEGEDKNDIIAFLNKDMSWDVREILNEKSELNDSGECITIAHNKLGVFKNGSTFDKFVRKALIEMEQAQDKNNFSSGASTALQILADNSYNALDN